MLEVLSLLAKNHIQMVWGLRRIYGIVTPLDYQVCSIMPPFPHPTHKSGALSFFQINDTTYFTNLSFDFNR